LRNLFGFYNFQHPPPPSPISFFLFFPPPLLSLSKKKRSMPLSRSLPCSHALPGDPAHPRRACRHHPRSRGPRRRHGHRPALPLISSADCYTDVFGVQSIFCAFGCFLVLVPDAAGHVVTGLHTALVKMRRGCGWERHELGRQKVAHPS
jgi:hypothetical protein